MLNGKACRPGIAARLFYSALTIALAGCAGASVAPGVNNAPVTSNRPDTVYVYPFAVTAQEVTLNQSIFQRAYREMSSQNETQDQLQLAEQTAQALANYMVKDLQNLGFVASVVPRGQQVSGTNILVVDGDFQDINEGNRLRRMVIGLGSGQSTLSAEVTVYQVTGGGTQQVMAFTTQADSGKMPGAAFTAPAGAAAGGAMAAASLGANLAAGAGKAYTSATDTLARRSAKQGVAYMSQYFGQQNWIPQNMVQDPKVAGSQD
jgi:hypothetical protein